MQQCRAGVTFRQSCCEHVWWEWLPIVHLHTPIGFQAAHNDCDIHRSVPPVLAGGYGQAVGAQRQLHGSCLLPPVLSDQLVDVQARQQLIIVPWSGQQRLWL